MKKMLILYYSWSNGNTKRMAEMLAQATGADIERIETVKPYTGSYDHVVSQAQDEVRRHYRPAIRPLSHRLAEYDVIAVGTPTWWYTMAPAVATLLTENDFHGKTVIPFMTNAGWPGTVIKDMKRAAKGADFAAEMEIKFDSSGGDHLETGKAAIDKWLRACQAALE